MRIAHLKVVTSSGLPGMRSIRGPKGRGDGAHEHITAAGFEDGEDVVLISKKDLLGIYAATGLEPDFQMDGA